MKGSLQTPVLAELTKEAKFVSLRLQGSGSMPVA